MRELLLRFIAYENTLDWIEIHVPRVVWKFESVHLEKHPFEAYKWVERHVGYLFIDVVSQSCKVRQFSYCVSLYLLEIRVVRSGYIRHLSLWIGRGFLSWYQRLLVALANLRGNCIKLDCWRSRLSCAHRILSDRRWAFRFRSRATLPFRNVFMELTLSGFRGWLSSRNSVDTYSLVVYIEGRLSGASISWRIRRFGWSGDRNVLKIS